MKTNTPDYSTPESAVLSALAAYRQLDTDLVMQTRDFSVDANLFWQDIGLPVDDNQIAETADALRVNFKREIEENGVTDYNSVKTVILTTETPKDSLAIVTLHCAPDDGEETSLRLGLIRTSTGWKLALVPGLDQL